MDESATVLRFLSEDVAARVDRMMAEGSLELAVDFDPPTDTQPPVQLGWVTVGNDHYRCKVVELPTCIEAYLRGGQGDQFNKAGDVTQAIVVAAEPDNLREQNQASLVVEMLPLLCPDGLTPPTRGIREHWGRLEAVLSATPAEADVAALMDTAKWLEDTLPQPGRTVTVTPGDQSQ